MNVLEIDDSRMPLRLGSVLRIPSYAYPEWGIPEGSFRRQSDIEYSVEWKKGSDKQMDYVVEAITRTGLGNYSQILRDANAKLVTEAIKHYKGKVNVLEVGFGRSTVDMADEMIRAGSDMDRVFITGIEPSEKRAEKHASELEEMNLIRGENFEVYTDTDNHILEYVGPNSQDIVCTVAAIHHHAYLDTPFSVIYSALRGNGIFTVSDWHNSVWEHPNRVYKLLDTMEWDGKELDMKRFAKQFPEAIQEAPMLGQTDERANEQIGIFWRDGWVPTRGEAITEDTFNEDDEIFMLEGHRPAERYGEEMESAGFDAQSPFVRELYQGIGFRQNPEQHLDDSRILMSMTGQKPAAE